MVHTRNYSQGDKWIPGRIAEDWTSIIYRGTQRHQDQIFSRENENDNEGNLERGSQQEWSRKSVISEVEEKPNNDMNSDAVPGPKWRPVNIQQERQKPDYYGHK